MTAAELPTQTAAARDAALGEEVRRLGTAGRDLPVLRVYTSYQAHSSVDKAAITLGLGHANVVRLPSDEHNRLSPVALDEAIRRGPGRWHDVRWRGRPRPGHRRGLPAARCLAARGRGVRRLLALAPSLAEPVEDLGAAD